jgi:uncharacterized membrane protein
MFSEMDSKAMNTANQNMAVGCIMIVFALGFGIMSVLLNEHQREIVQIEAANQQYMLYILHAKQSIDTLHQAVQNTVCIMLQARWSTDMIMTTILKTVEHAMQIHTMNATTVCPIIYR